MNNIYHQSIRVLSSGPITGLTGQLRPQLVEMIVDSIVATSSSTNETVNKDRDFSEDAANKRRIT
jgi:hypothetical protein|tara:strand:+ start:139 stop:333 length:195 start_codon:yes stop_codon:yes gene_type:complete